jgi:hypothetical protein
MKKILRYTWRFPLTFVGFLLDTTRILLLIVCQLLGMVIDCISWLLMNKAEKEARYFQTEIHRMALHAREELAKREA